MRHQTILYTQSSVLGLLGAPFPRDPASKRHGHQEGIFLENNFYFELCKEANKRFLDGIFPVFSCLDIFLDIYNTKCLFMYFIEI